MDGIPHRSDQLSWIGILLIVGMVGLNTAFTLHGQPGVASAGLASQPWLVDYAVHFSLGLLVIGAIVYNRRR